MKTNEKAVVETMKRPEVKTTLREIPFSELFSEPNQYSFRDSVALDTGNKSIEELAEDIRLSKGLTTPLLVKKLKDGGYLVLDGHRRNTALRLLANQKTQGFGPDFMVPVNVIPADVEKRELLIRAASANLSRREFTKTERARVAKVLYEEGVSETEIQRLLNIKKTQYERDIAVANCDWLMSMVERNCINYSNAARLLQTAKASGRDRDLRSALLEFEKITVNELKEENRRRRANDQKEKTGDQLHPQKYLKSDQISAWESDLKSGRKLSEPSFKFKALVNESRGVKTLEISSLNLNVNEMHTEDVAKVIKRLYDVLSELEPIAQEKRNESVRSQSNDGSSGKSAGDKRLQELGLDLDIDEDVDGEVTSMDEATERQEVDFSEMYNNDWEDSEPDPELDYEDTLEPDFGVLGSEVAEGKLRQDGSESRQQPE